MLKPAQFRMIHDPKTDRWIGQAYAPGLLVHGGNRSTYTGAREALTSACAIHGYEPKGFDGEFSQSDAGLVKIAPSFIRGHTIKHGSQTGLTVDFTQIKHGCNWVVAHDLNGTRYDLPESACSLDR